MAGKDRFVVDVSPLTPKLKEVALKELNEDPAKVPELVEELRQKLKELNKYNYPDDDAFYIAVMRPCKFYVSSTIDELERIAAFKKKYENVLTNLDPNTEANGIMNNDIINVLVDRDQCGRRILVLKLGGTWNPKQVSTDSVFRMLYMLHLVAFKEPTTQVAGFVTIMDFNGMGLKQATSLNLSFAAMLLSFIQDAMPLRMKALHIVNQPMYFNIVWKIFQPLFREKLSKRVFLHGKKMEELHKHISSSNLPEDYGGKLPKMDYTSKDWMPTIQALAPESKIWEECGYKK